MSFEFLDTKARFEAVVREVAAKKLSGEAAQEHLTASLPAPDSDNNRNTLQLAFRVVLLSILKGQAAAAQQSNKDDKSFEHTEPGMLIDAAIWCAQNDYLPCQGPLEVIEDCFDCETINGCHRLFSFVQERVDQLTQPKLFPAKSRNVLLRICNGLLRRLSKTNNTMFCGDILLLMAFVLPLDERSGVNMASYFNTSNTTSFEQEGSSKGSNGTTNAEEESSMAVDESSKPTGAAGRTVDLAFYRELWGMQAFFSNPVKELGNTAQHWPRLITGIDRVLTACEAQRLTGSDARAAAAVQAASSGGAAFPKYLTSSKLVNLQMRDPSLRRHLLLQFMILFQFLLGSTTDKQRRRMHAGTKETTTRIKKHQTRVRALIKATPPRGEQFLAEVDQFLEREKTWIAWKHERPPCPKLERAPVDLSQGKMEMPESEEEKKAKKQKLAQAKKEREMMAMMGMAGSSGAPKPDEDGRLLMGTKELAMLWNPANDTTEALSSSDRDFVPDRTEFLQQMLDDEDPDFGVAEEELKQRSDKRYIWRSLRLTMAGDMPLLFKYHDDGMKGICKQLMGGGGSGDDDAAAAAAAAAGAAAESGGGDGANADTKKRKREE